MNTILQFGAFARRPLIERIHELQVETHFICTPAWESSTQLLLTRVALLLHRRLPRLDGLERWVTSIGARQSALARAHCPALRAPCVHGEFLGVRLCFFSPSLMCSFGRTMHLYSTTSSFASARVAISARSQNSTRGCPQSHLPLHPKHQVLMSMWPEGAQQLRWSNLARCK
jgi:hypothetical protein